MFNRKKGRFTESKPNKERKVISYEDMPLDDYEQERTDMSPEAVKKIIFGVVIALVAGLVVFVFANRDKLSPDNIAVWWTYDVLGNGGGGFPVNIVGSEVKSGNFTVNQSRVAYASDTSFVTLNSSGKEAANIQLRYSKPVLKSSENRFLAYGLGETGYQLLSFDKNTYTGVSEGGVIYTGDVCRNGCYCIVTEGSGFLSELFAYDKNNNRVFKYSFSEYYINSVALNPDGSGCVACGITSDGGAMKAGVYVLDFGLSDPVSTYTIDGDAILDCKYLSGSRAALVGRNSAYIVKPGSEDLIAVGYNERPVVNYCFMPNSNSFALALSKSGDGRSCILATYDDNGGKTAEIETDNGADAFSVYKGTLAVLDGNTLYAYNSLGELKYTADAGTGAKAALLTSDTKAYVLSVNQIRLIDFNHPASPDSAS